MVSRDSYFVAFREVDMFQVSTFFRLVYRQLCLVFSLSLNNNVIFFFSSVPVMCIFTRNFIGRMGGQGHIISIIIFKRFHQLRTGSSGVVPGPASSAPPGSLSEMQILKFYSRPPETLRVCPSYVCFKRSPGGSRAN